MAATGMAMLQETMSETILSQARQHCHMMPIIQPQSAASDEATDIFFPDIFFLLETDSH